MRKRLSDTLDLLNSSVASEGCCGTLNEDSCLRASERHLRDLNAVLSEAKVWRIDDDLIDQGDAWVARLEVTHELLRMLSLTRAAMPIKTQADFVQYIHTLERGIRRAERGAGNTQVVEAAKTLISHAQIEFWLQGIVARLKGVEVAAEEHEHDILKLGAAIEKAKLLSAGSVLLDGAVVLHARLVAELEGSRSLQSVPTVRLPMENPPEGYYQPSDKGKIIETAGHPLPPEGGVYQWEQSASFAALSKAMDRMRAVLNNVDGTGINMTLVSQLKEKLFRAEKDYKQLEIKENNDKQLAVDLATKQAKKLKKRSKGLKKKK